MRTITNADISQRGLELKQVVLSCFTQSAEDFAHIAELFPDADDFRTNHAEFIPALYRLHIELAGRDTIQLS